MKVTPTIYPTVDGRVLSTLLSRVGFFSKNYLRGRPTVDAIEYKNEEEFFPTCMHHNINERKEAYHGVRRPRRECWRKTEFEIQMGSYFKRSDTNICEFSKSNEASFVLGIEDQRKSGGKGVLLSLANSSISFLTNSSPTYLEFYFKEFNKKKDGFGVLKDLLRKSCKAYFPCVLDDHLLLRAKFFFKLFIVVLLLLISFQCNLPLMVMTRDKHENMKSKKDRLGNARPTVYPTIDGRAQSMVGTIPSPIGF
ncbi:hypothetical protein M9H77_23364 [Catharanthus roseus]|uniref:Uncharacterized protein n=1 Tax=Catharanthus roseus TaxID=4058 RepID=A0ACC0ATT8_CATRO|nr:hypothetical protein M9H77_23364 [Catharanthus roseus]